MSITFIKGNIMTSSCQTLVNPVNCVGVMGKGLALQFKERYPQMFEKYKYYCDKKLLRPGMLWIYTARNGKKILCFPTKDDWRKPSKVEWIEAGLKKFGTVYREKNITSIAFPLLGAGCGGLQESVSLRLMETCLHDVDIPIEIYVTSIPMEEQIGKKVSYLESVGFEAVSMSKR